MPKPETPRKQTDPTVKALVTIVRVLEALGPTERDSVLAFVAAKFKQA